MIDLVIGYGEIGKPLYDILSVKRDIDWLDLDDKTINDHIEVMHICYPYNDAFIEHTLYYILRLTPKLVIIHSTVLPGTTRKISDKTNIPIGYSPIRGRHTKMHRDIVRYNKFVSGVYDRALRLILGYFEEVGIFNIEIMMPVESLELSKLLETTYSGLLVAWSQEIDRFACDVGVSISHVLRFTREIDYLPDFEFYPGYIGGHCIMQNLHLLEEMRKSPAVDFIRESNDMCTEGKKQDRIRHIPKRIESCER